MSGMVLSRFTPSVMSREALEEIFVQRGRQRLAEQIVATIRESALTPAKHYSLVVGPRGIGKTHLVSIVYHRVREMEDLDGKLLVAWLREEEWGIASFLDLLLRVLRALPGDAAPDIENRVERLYGLSADAAEREAASLLAEVMKGRTLLLLVENLDELFYGLGDAGQKKWRAFIQEHPFWTIVATSPSLFGGVDSYDEPFYGFFTLYSLDELTVEEATDLLQRVAQLRNDAALAVFLKTPAGRARVRAVGHLAGGNHRIYITLSEIITHDSLDELASAILDMLDKLTPYYQSRMSLLPAGQRKIVEFLCEWQGAAPVKGIAQRCFISHQSASSQLSKLKEMGYVTSTAEGRESYYEIREPLMRLCLDVKKNRSEPIRLFVDFLRLWYSKDELRRRMDATPESASERAYFARAVRLAEEMKDDPIIAACLRDQARYLADKNYTSAYRIAEELTEIRGAAADWRNKSLAAFGLGDLPGAIAAIDRALELAPDNDTVVATRGVLLGHAGRNAEALAAFERAIEIDPDYGDAWHYKGIALARLGRFDEALAALDRALELDTDGAAVWKLRCDVLVEAGSARLALDTYDEALAALDEAVAVAPESAVAWNTRGTALFGLGRYDEALSSFERALDLDPSVAPFPSVHGFLLNVADRYEDALAALDRAIEADSKDAFAWHQRGNALFVLDRHDDAVASYDRALELEPEDALATYNRASALAALGRWDVGLAGLDDAMRRASTGEKEQIGNVAAILSILLASPLGIAWGERAAALAGIHERHGALAALGEGLVRTIEDLASPLVSDAAARAWLDAWRAAGGAHEELELPVRLLDAAVRYRETGDRRVLLELPAEQRSIVAPMLGASV